MRFLEQVEDAVISSVKASTNNTPTLVAASTPQGEAIYGLKLMLTEQMTLAHIGWLSRQVLEETKAQSVQIFEIDEHREMIARFDLHDNPSEGKLLLCAVGPAEGARIALEKIALAEAHWRETLRTLDSDGFATESSGKEPDLLARHA